MTRPLTQDFQFTVCLYSLCIVTYLLLAKLVLCLDPLGHFGGGVSTPPPRYLGQLLLGPLTRGLELLPPGIRIRNEDEGQEEKYKQ